MALTMQASHNAWRRPRYVEKMPATSDETNEPSVRRDVINCWTVLWNKKVVSSYIYL